MEAITEKPIFLTHLGFWAFTILIGYAALRFNYRNQKSSETFLKFGIYTNNSLNITSTLETLQNKPSNLHLVPRNSYLNNRNRVIAPQLLFFFVAS